ncbi:MAG: peroxiredoxin [Zymomonas mobilis]|nr:peroxiredoxin [Zymomonas mobilis]
MIKKIASYFSAYVLCGLFSLIAGTPSYARLSMGFHAPPFEASGMMMAMPFHFNLDQTLKNGPAVLYFSAAGMDLGCREDAQPLLKAAPKLRLYGAFLIAFSVTDQSPSILRNCRVQLPVAIANQSITKLYAVNYPLSPAQNTTYVIAPDRRILLTYVSDDPASHMAKAMEVIQNWQKSGRK